MKKVILSFAFLFATVCMYPTVLLTEDFDYAVGTAIGETDSWTTAGTLTTGDGRVTNATTLEYSNAGGTYGHSGSKTLKHNYSAGSNYISCRGFSRVTSGAVYLTYMYKADGNQSQSQSELLGLSNSPTSPSARPWVGKLASGTTDGSVFRFGLTLSSGASGDIKWATGEYSKNDVQLIVLKYDFTNSQVALFVNPTLGTSVEPDADVTDNSGSVRSRIDTLMFRNNGNSKSSYYIGGIRVSTTWAEALRAVENIPEAGFAKIETDFNDGTWGDIPSNEYTSGSYPTATINNLQLIAAGLRTGSTTYESNTLRNRVCLDKVNNAGSIILPILNTVQKIDVYASAGSEDKNILLQRYNYKTGLWDVIDRYNLTTKNTCYKFTTVLNSNITTLLRIANADGSVKNIWKIETTPTVTREWFVANFSEEGWSALGTSSTDTTVNEVDFTSCAYGSGTYYTVSCEKLTGRINLLKGSMMELPPVASAARVDVYVAAGSANKDLKIQKYNYYTSAWEEVETLHFEVNGIYYRFAVTLNSASVTKLRLVNADSSSKYILKVITYAASPTTLSAPMALEATNISAHSFTTRWTSVDGATGYRVVRYKSDGTIQRVETVDASATTFTFRDTGEKGVAASTDYSYAVVAIGDEETIVDSELSNKIDLTTAPEITDSYTRTVTNGNYGTICLPKAAPDLSDAGAVFFEVAGKVMDGSKLTQIVFDEVTSLEAGKPYVFQATSDELNIPLTGDAVAKPDNRSSNGLIGSFTVDTVSSSVYVYVLSNNLLYCSKDQSYYVGENRAYFKVDVMSEYSGAAPAPGRRRVVMHAAEEQVATALDELTTTNSCCKIVRNGQIIIIRNGVQFDVTGRQIK